MSNVKSKIKLSRLNCSTTNHKGINSMMYSKLEVITPKQASEILKNKNKNNRNLNASTVSVFARDMAEGRWGVTHQGIAFYTDGTLADGQHRLAAIVQSKIPLTVMVTYNSSTESAMMVDTGRSRSITDVLRMSGKANWIDKRMLPVTTMIYRVDKASADEVILLAESIKQSLVFTNKVFSKNIRGLTAPVRSAMALAHYYGEDESRLTEFAEMFYSGVISDARDTAVVKIRDLMMFRQVSTSGSTARYVDLNKSQNAIYRFCQYKQTNSLRELQLLPYPLLSMTSVVCGNHTDVKVSS